MTMYTTVLSLLVYSVHKPRSKHKAYTLAHTDRTTAAFLCPLCNVMLGNNEQSTYEVSVLSSSQTRTYIYINTINKVLEVKYTMSKYVTHAKGSINQQTYSTCVHRTHRTYQEIKIVSMTLTLKACFHTPVQVTCMLHAHA